MPITMRNNAGETPLYVACLKGNKDAAIFLAGSDVIILCVFVFVCVCTHTHTHTYTYIHTLMHTLIYIYTHTHTSTHTHTMCRRLRGMSLMQPE